MTDVKSVLIVVTSHDHLNSEHATGLWFEEFATPYRLFAAQGYEITVASTKGGKAPVDPDSMPAALTPEDREILDLLEHTLPLHEVDEELEVFDAVFFPGGHGTMFDLPDNADVARLLTEFSEEDKIIASVCHGPAALVGARRADGTPLVKGRKVAAFTNEEEAVVELDKIVPFLLESRLRELGAEVDTRPAWSDHVVVDGKLVTGQNPQSSDQTAREVIRLLSG